MLACGTAAIHRYSLLAECGLSAVRSALIKGRPASNETFGTGQRAALIQPQARTGRAYRSLALSTKHSGFTTYFGCLRTCSFLGRSAGYLIQSSQCFVRLRSSAHVASWMNRMRSLDHPERAILVDVSTLCRQR